MISENEAATENPTPDGDGNQEPATMASLADLLADAPAPDSAPKENGEADGNIDKNAAPTKFNDLAEAMGMELDDLYKLEVATTDGKTVTIEDMKALQNTHDEIAIRELEFEESRVKKEGDMRQAQSELAEIVSGLPNGTLKPEVLEKLRAKNAARIEIEQTRTIDAIPSWKDDDIRKKDMVGMTAHLERFGYPANHLQNISNHRDYVFIRESFLREQRIQKALEKVRVGAPNPIPTTKPRTASGKKGRTVRKNSNARNGLEAFFSNV